VNNIRIVSPGEYIEMHRRREGDTMHKITMSEGDRDPVYTGAMHNGALSQVEVRKGLDEILIDVQPAAGVDYVVTVNGNPCTRGSG
jgi:hypothetical protein